MPQNTLVNNNLVNLVNLDNLVDDGHKNVANKNLKETMMENFLNNDGFIQTNISIKNLMNIYNDILVRNNLIDSKYKLDFNFDKKLSLATVGSTFGLFLITESELNKLNEMVSFVENVIDCRHFQLSNYFGERTDEKINWCNGVCDNCIKHKDQSNVQEKDMTQHTL